MTRLTMDQAIIVMGYTGTALAPFGAFHADVEKRLGRAVWTHQFPSLMGEIKDAYREDFIALAPEDQP